MSDEGSLAPPLWLIAATLGIYAGFLVAYGDEVFSGDAGDCNGLVDCTTAIFSMIGNLFEFLTLGGTDSPLVDDLPGFGGILQGVLVLFMAMSWGVIITRLITDAVGAVNPL